MDADNCRRLAELFFLSTLVVATFVVAQAMVFTNLSMRAQTVQYPEGIGALVASARAAGRSAEQQMSVDPISPLRAVAARLNRVDLDTNPSMVIFVKATAHGSILTVEAERGSQHVKCVFAMARA